MINPKWQPTTLMFDLQVKPVLISCKTCGSQVDEPSIIKRVRSLPVSGAEATLCRPVRYHSWNNKTLRSSTPSFRAEVSVSGIVGLIGYGTGPFCRTRASSMSQKDHLWTITEVRSHIGCAVCPNHVKLNLSFSKFCSEILLSWTQS